MTERIDLDAIRHRHAARTPTSMWDDYGIDAHDDRGVLLAEVDRLREALSEVCSQIGWFDLDKTGRLTGSGTVWIELTDDTATVIRSVLSTGEARADG